MCILNFTWTYHILNLKKITASLNLYILFETFYTLYHKISVILRICPGVALFAWPTPWMQLKAYHTHPSRPILVSQHQVSSSDNRLGFTDNNTWHMFTSLERGQVRLHRKPWEWSFLWASQNIKFVMPFPVVTKCSISFIIWNLFLVSFELVMFQSHLLFC